MVERERQRSKVSRPGDSASETERLPYRIELWDEADQETIERVLARAFSVTLARAIFKAAQNEHPDRRITLRHGTRVIADSAREPTAPIS